MSAGPLRRVTATIGLLGLVPIAVLLVTGAVTPEVAAVRAVAVVATVVVVGNVARVVLTSLLRQVEGQDPALVAAGELAWDGDERRRAPRAPAAWSDAERDEAGIVAADRG